MNCDVIKGKNWKDLRNTLRFLDLDRGCLEVRKKIGYWNGEAKWRPFQ